MAKKMGRPVLANWMRNHGYDAVPHYEFYRELFPQGELAEWSPNPKEMDEPEWRFNGVIIEHTKKMKTVPKRDRETGKTYYTEKEQVYRHIVCDDLLAIDRVVEKSQETGHYCYMSPISYCGRSRATKNERFLYALVIEIDGLITKKVDGQRNLQQRGMENLIHQWGGNNNPKWTGGIYIAPTAVVCSGNGVHLYWFLKDPYPLYPDKDAMGVSDYVHQLEVFRDGFVKYIWNDAITDWPLQKEYHGQSFRIVGTPSKKGEIVEAFWITKKRYSMEELFDQKGHLIGDKKAPAPKEFWLTKTKKDMDLTKCADRKMSPTMLAAQKQWPEWFQERIVEKKPAKAKGQWTADERVYDWYKTLIQEDPHVGCRYYRLYTLAQYGAKCGIPYHIVRDDCWALGHQFQEIDTKQPLENWEIQKAIQAYFHPQAVESKIDFINERAHLNIEKNKRNGRRRKEHLQAERILNEKGIPLRNPCRDNRESVLQYMQMNGMIHGRPDKASIVKQWRADNPTGKKADCARETGLDPKTIRKWWDN